MTILNIHMYIIIYVIFKYSLVVENVKNKIFVWLNIVFESANSGKKLS